ncbi:C-C motif chemokine 4-like [Lates calcarifer]|uniref:C-C motif chemokine 4-like n=1 Tax=Lates calcarifer TaxID=8187 RepID=A0AAJ7VFW2_LATCA|nr:C-C motif chemokine 4-like [Lates calcarifer]
MMMMKNPVVLVACTLLFSSLAVLASQSSFGPEECCFKFASKPLPKRKVISYKHTEDLCPMRGALFTMLSGTQICVDPEVLWVQNIMKAKDKLQAKNVTTSVPTESN